MKKHYKNTGGTYTAIRQSNFLQYFLYMKNCKEPFAKLEVSNNTMITFLSHTFSFNTNALKQIASLTERIELDYTSYF